MSFPDSAWTLFEQLKFPIIFQLPQRPIPPYADILLADALACGLDPQRYNAWGCVWPMWQQKGDSSRDFDKTIVMVSERFARQAPYNEGWSPIALHVESGEIISLLPWHLAVKLRNNPLSLHSHCRPYQKPEISIYHPLKTDTIFSKAELSRYTEALYKELTWLQGLDRLKQNQGGAPQHNANAWLIEQVFDKNRDQNELLDEWLRRREVEGKVRPVDPRKAMREVIRIERNNRQKTRR